jgi:hypothetical protein
MFGPRTKMEKGTAVLFHHMKCFGFLMHIGREDGGKSKTEALYIPLPGVVTTNADRSKIVLLITWIKDM